MDNENMNPVEIQKYLSGVDYPANKQDLIEHARSQGARQEAIDMLNSLPDKDYESPADLASEMGNDM